MKPHSLLRGFLVTRELSHLTRIIPLLSVSFFETHGVRDYYQCVFVYVCGLSRQCQEIPRVDLNITPRYINYMGNTWASEDM